MKTVSGGETTKLQSGAFQPADLILIEVEPTPVGFWFGGWGTAMDGLQAYVGCGDLLTTGNIDTSADGVINGYDLILSGLKSEELALVEGTDYHQAPVIRKSAMLAADGVTLTNVRTVSSDRLDFIVRRDVPNALLVATIRGGSQLVKGRGGQYRTHIAQMRIAYPIVDLFFDEVGQTGRSVRYWGMKNALRASGSLGITGGGGPQGKAGSGIRGSNS